MSNFQDMQAEVGRYKALVPQIVGVINSIPEKVAAAVAAATDGAVDQTAFDSLVTDIKTATDSVMDALAKASQ